MVPVTVVTVLRSQRELFEEEVSDYVGVKANRSAPTEM